MYLPHTWYIKIYVFYYTSLCTFSGWLQVLFLAGFTNSIINQHVTRDETNRADMDMYASTLQPCICSKVQDREVSIMWVNSGAHIVPLFHKECVVP